MVDASVPDIALEPDKTVRKVQVDHPYGRLQFLKNNPSFETHHYDIYVEVKKNL
jgi:hypothetical protein